MITLTLAEASTGAGATRLAPCAHRLPFRQLVRLYDVDLVYSPMITADSFILSQRARDVEFTTNAGASTTARSWQAQPLRADPRPSTWKARVGPCVQATGPWWCSLVRAMQQSSPLPQSLSPRTPAPSPLAAADSADTSDVPRGY